MLLAQRAFGSNINPHDFHLNRVFILLIVTVAQLHIEHAGYGISIFSRKSSGEEIGISEHLRTKGRKDSSAQRSDIGKMIRIGDFNIFQSPLQQMGRIAMNGNAIG